MVRAANEVAEEANEVVEEENITLEEDFFNKFGWQIKFENTLNYFFNYKYKLE